MPPPVARRSRRSTLAIARLGVLVLVIAVVAVVVAITGTDGLRTLLTDVGESRWSYVAFIVVYAVVVVLMLPGTLGTLTAGAIFGFPYGGFAALAGASIGATGAFFISRLVGREGAQELFGTRLGELDDFVGRNDFTSMLLLRLMPIVPFNVLNYGSGLTSVRPSRYVGASVLGMAPGTFLTAAVADQADDPTSRTFLILVGLFIIALIGSIAVGSRLRKSRGTDV